MLCHDVARMFFSVELLDLVERLITRLQGSAKALSKPLASLLTQPKAGQAA